MSPDGINPRTGMVVAVCSIFLVFGFMFMVSGTKGETLGDIPLIAMGPAICLPGVAPQQDQRLHHMPVQMAQEAEETQEPESPGTREYVRT
ncbi:hypothetical protein AAFF_G00350190 [Aldrovandia affinis]|uniref:Uncharacterized protein n=1 Tax=Aldrovandia affinis TaxID=143900 RepID=A0AAD7WNZ2_9TELE|nr:hypothetical protein AAFF_G00350190 [Aldrovandia affinis]